MGIKKINRRAEAELVEAGAALASTSSASARLPNLIFNFHKYVTMLSMALLLVGCSLSLLDPNPPTSAVAQQFIETQLRTHVQARYAAHLAGTVLPMRFLQTFEREPTSTLPATVTAAYDFYFAAVEAADWGNVYLLAPTIQGRNCYLIFVTTDGDDGWLELYRPDGSPLGTARYYLELVSWGEKALLRQQTRTGEFPATLQTRLGETLWGK